MKRVKHNPLAISGLILLALLALHSCWYNILSSVEPLKLSSSTQTIWLVPQPLPIAWISLVNWTCDFKTRVSRSQIFCSKASLVFQSISRQMKLIALEAYSPSLPNSFSFHLLLIGHVPCQILCSHNGAHKQTGWSQYLQRVKIYRQAFRNHHNMKQNKDMCWEGETECCGSLDRDIIFHRWWVCWSWRV